MLEAGLPDAFTDQTRLSLEQSEEYTRPRGGTALA
jgi:hypothetical protein